MLIGDLLSFLRSIFESLFSMLGLASGGSPPSLLDDPSKLRVYIKHSGGKTLQVDLEPQWTVSKVKEVVAPKLGVNSADIRIIFAGNELPDHFILESCDVGQQSYLHAVIQICDSTTKARPLCSPSVDDDSNLARRTRTFSTHDQSEDNTSSSDVLSEDVDSKGQSEFFIFCSQCESLQEGKLRVRCSTCLSGAFTVFQHPSGWDDVIVPSKIRGSCQEGCAGIFAQFYFKCANHITKGEDDSSPPVPLVRRNPETVPCLACGDMKGIILVFPCDLSHATCVDCFKDYVMVKLNQREFVQDETIGYTLGCPALCAQSLITDPHHFKLVGKYQYDRYQRFATEECLLQMGGLFCPQPDCGMGIIPLESSCDKIACLHGCGYVFCRKCLEGWHIGPCRSEGQPLSAPSSSSEKCYTSTGYFVSEDRAAAAQWGDATRRAMRLSTKPCPNCRVPTERSGGCMHMECTKCNFAWCWVCQTKWTRDCMGNHWFG